MTKTTRLASTNKTPSVTARRSTDALDDAPSTTMTRIAYANVARNSPNASFVMPDRTKVRITRGDSWALANCRATSVIVKTTPTKVSIDAAIMPRSASAEPALTGKPPPTLSTPGIESALETATPTASPAASNAVGTTQNRSLTHSWTSTTRSPFLDSGRSAFTDTGGTTTYLVDQSVISVTTHRQARHDTRHNFPPGHHPSGATSHASADTKLVIELRGELSDIRQRCAIDRCDRNRPAETAGPESAS